MVQKSGVHQLRLVVYPIICDGFYTYQVVQDFFHQQYGLPNLCILERTFFGGTFFDSNHLMMVLVLKLSCSQDFLYQAFLFSRFLLQMVDLRIPRNLLPGSKTNAPARRLGPKKEISSSNLSDSREGSYVSNTSSLNRYIRLAFEQVKHMAFHRGSPRKSKSLPAIGPK